MTLDACAALVEKADPDRFAATMAAPVAARARLWPLYALNIELARAAYASDEPMIAEMRLQWWQDQLDLMGRGGEGQGDLAPALAPLLREVPGVAPLITGLIEARRWDCWREGFADAGALRRYLDATAGGLMVAAARALGAGPGADQPLRDFGFGAGLANWLDAVPALKARGRHPLPDEGPGAIAALARQGLDAITRARAARAGVPVAAHPALWAGWSAGVRLRAALARPQAVLDGALPEPRLTRAPALMWRVVTGYW